MIKRKMTKVNESGLRQAKFSHFNATVTTKTKGKIRREVDAIPTSDDQPYDLYDQMADALGAIQALVAVADANGWNITGNQFVKFAARQSEIATVVSAHPAS